MYSFNRYHFPAIRYEAGWWMITDISFTTAGDAPFLHAYHLYHPAVFIEENIAGVDFRPNGAAGSKARIFYFHLSNYVFVKAVLMRLMNSRHFNYGTDHHLREPTAD